MKTKQTPDKNCLYCGAKMERKRFGGRLEAMSVFLRRKFCGKGCMGISSRLDNPGCVKTNDRFMGKDQLQSRLLAATGIPTRAGCWPFTGALSRDGYGLMEVGGQYGYRTSASRVCAHVFHGLSLSDKSQLALHTCDNPSCVNPAHLYIGTVADNARDRTERGRGKPMRGSMNGRAKLTPQQVSDIRARYVITSANCSNIRHLSSEFGVSLSHIRAIVSGRRWTLPSAKAAVEKAVRNG